MKILSLLVSVLRVAAIASVMCTLHAASAEAAGPVIKWRVENPFRFFTDPADSEVHREIGRAHV